MNTQLAGGELFGVANPFVGNYHHPSEPLRGYPSFCEIPDLYGQGVEEEEVVPTQIRYPLVRGFGGVSEVWERVKSTLRTDLGKIALLGAVGVGLYFISKKGWDLRG